MWDKRKKRRTYLFFFNLSVSSIPLLEYGVNLVVPEFQDVLCDVVDLTDGLHIPVLDPVVDHVD